LLDHDRPAVAWGHLNTETDLMTKLIDGAVQISGSDSDESKEEKFLAFQDGEIRVLAAQLSTCRTGVDFTRAGINVYLQNTYSIETRLQSEKRTHRLGMDMERKHVMYYDLIYRNTVEVKQYNRLRDGVDFSTAVTDGVDIREVLDGEWRIR